MSNFDLYAMEPVTITTTATAIATILFTKVIEKPGEALAQSLWDKTQNLIGRLKGKSDKLTGLLEGSPQQPLDNREVVSELKALADKNPEIAQAIQEIEAEARKITNPQFQPLLQEVREKVNKLPEKELTSQNQTTSAKKIKNNYNYQAQNMFFGQTDPS